MELDSVGMDTAGALGVHELSWLMDDLHKEERSRSSISQQR